MSSAPRPIRLDLAEGRVAALDFGDPERPIDVLFLHATGFNARTDTDGLSRAAGRIRIVAVDQRGHGLTELPADPAAARSWTPFADDLIAVREALMDSPLAQGAARRRGMFQSKAAALAAYTGRGAFKTWPAQTLADYVEDGFRPSPDGGVELTCAPAWESVVFGRQDHDVWAALDRTRAPLRILRAEHGTTCHVKPESDIDGHPNRRLETVAGTSHFLPMERPDLVAEALVAASL